jgi:hypothetical protein
MTGAAQLMVLMAACTSALAGTGALLPLQDRTGDPEMAAAVQAALAARLFPAGDPVAGAQLRDAMRRLRLRDPLNSSPQVLAELGVEIGADWFFAATLHQITREPVPQLTLSAQVFTPGGEELSWAGFIAASGLDQRRLLGRGQIDSLEILARQASLQIADDYLSHAGSLPASPRRRGPAVRSGFRSQPYTPRSLGTVAVIPFDSVTDRDAGLHGALMTDVALAVLSRRQVRVVLPAIVAGILRQQGELARGELDATARDALRRTTSADHIFTGTVEMYRPGAAGLEPDPWISFSARALATDSGRIVWSAGLEQRGSQHPGPFKTRRIHAAGRLAEQMMEALVDGLLKGPS